MPHGAHRRLFRAGAAHWQAGELPVGQALAEPRPLFRKLDPDIVVAEELARMERSASA